MAKVNRTQEELRDLMIRTAKAFLNTADELNELVSEYIDGSNDPKAEAAYNMVKTAETAFLFYYNEYYGETVKPALNYELAESVI